VQRLPARLPARLVTTPQTVQSFTRASSMGWLAWSIRSRCYVCATMAVGGAGFARLRGDGRRPEPLREGFCPLVAGAKQPIVVQQGLWSYAADQLGSPLRLEREVSFGDS
jgi:hypothetical protein